MMVNCPNKECKLKSFEWQPSPDDQGVRSVDSQSYSLKCPGCQMRLRWDGREISAGTEYDEIWTKFGKDSIEQTLGALDDRAKYMITTCASLIIINFGILTAFSSSLLSFKITPPLFFAISAALFGLSYFPRQEPLNIELPDKNRDAYNSWRAFKMRRHKYGFGAFIAGLFAIGITSLAG